MRSEERQYQHLLDSFVDPQRTPHGHRRASFSYPHHHHQRHSPRRQHPQPQQLTPQPSHRRSSFASATTLRVDLRDVTAILSVVIQVEGFHFDASIMEHPEFRIRTHVVFQCQRFGSQQLETSWRVHRTFHEFQGLDLQLRQKFPVDMCEIAPPRLHRRRTFFRMHKSKTFLNKRSLELNAYLAQVLDTSTMRLTRFMDPRAPLILRCFCNFDIGFGKKLRVRPNQYDAGVLCLDPTHHHHHHHQHHALGVPPPPPPPLPSPSPPPPPPLPLSHTAADDDDDDDDDAMEDEDHDHHMMAMRRPHTQSHSHSHSQSRSYERGAARSRTDSKFDELAANLLEDRARNMAMCQRFECSCHNMSIRHTEDKMARILRLRGFRASYRPREADGPSALFCVLFRLQQYNALDRKLHEILSEYQTSSVATATSDELHDETGDLDAAQQHQQLSAGVALVRDALSNFALLHVHAIAPHFRSTAVDLTKKIHEFKSGARHRTGALELVLLCSMLDLTIVLITNDHQGTVQEIFPLPDLPPLRRGGRLLLTMGYILPTMVCVNGLYVLAEELPPRTPTQWDPHQWQGLEEMDRALVTLIEREVLQSELRRIEPFDDALAEPLNRALLDAVWDDCGHNPHAFHLFQRQARQFGKGRMSAASFVQYLELAFGRDAAVYLVDFLLFVLPEATLRKQLLRARWRHVQRRLVQRVAAVAS